MSHIMVTVSVSDIPAHLVGTCYYNMMVEDDTTSEETICVPAQFYHAQTVPTSFVHGMQILETLRFWGCCIVPDEFFEAIRPSWRLPTCVESFWSSCLYSRSILKEATPTADLRLKR